MKNKGIKKMAVALLVMMFAMQSAYAGTRGPCGPGMMGGGMGMGRGMGMKMKFMQKAHFLLMNEDELGLSDEQVEKIKDLKTATKKDIILKEAEIDVVAVDIKALIWADPVDTKAIDKLIDKKYDLKKEKAKTLVAAYASLKGMLTDEQKDKMKELWKSYCNRDRD